MAGSILGSNARAPPFLPRGAPRVHAVGETMPDSASSSSSTASPTTTGRSRTSALAEAGEPVCFAARHGRPLDAVRLTCSDGTPPTCVTPAAAAGCATFLVVARQSRRAGVPRRGRGSSCTQPGWRGTSSVSARPSLGARAVRRGRRVPRSCGAQGTGASDRGTTWPARKPTVTSRTAARAAGNETPGSAARAARSDPAASRHDRSELDRQQRQPDPVVRERVGDALALDPCDQCRVVEVQAVGITPSHASTGLESTVRGRCAWS